MAPRRGGKRKQWKRKPRKSKRSTVVVNRALAPIAQRYITKMKFAADISTDATGNYAINLNSIWDPLRTGGASPNQPYGRDQLALLYNRYRVVSCGWRITAPNAVSAMQFGTLPSNEVTAFTAFSDLRETPRAKYVMQHPGGPCIVIKGKSYIPSLVGRTKAQYMADDRYQALMTTNPNEAAILNITVANFNGVPITTGQVLNVLLEYTVEFFDVHILPSS